jgi:CRISPR/Cas system-associated exonuclease Cas4 (RecB family)
MKLSKKLIKQVKNPKEYNSLENKFLYDLQKSICNSRESRPPSKSYKPSSFFCIRNMYYQLTGQELDGKKTDYENESSGIGINESGEDRHDRVQYHIVNLCAEENDYEWVDIEQYIKEKNLTELEVVDRCGFETKIYHKGLNLSFKCDGILKIKDEYVIFEYKTEASFKYKDRIKPEKHHIEQAVCYCLAFEIHKVLFIYEDRNFCKKKAFIEKISSRDFGKVKERIKSCDDYVKIALVPPKEQNEKLCKYCKYEKSCKKDG